MNRKMGVAVLFVAMLAVTAVVLLGMGRTPFGPDNVPGLWCGDIWSKQNSQRLADPYTFTHLLHGLAFFGLLWLAARKLPLRFRFLLAVFLEAAWEVVENSNMVIQRYREATVSLGYFGDSVLNSTGDILAMSAAFLFASRISWRVSVFIFISLEIVLALWIRDNLILNIIMLIHPIQAVKTWQLGG